uniref:Single-stranded DNA-binding protein n=1 Tax=Leclercia adecarboxylata TaxID=83655 RepID=A0A482M1N1_9ENTR|nr:Single-stranded DNA-binding protein [Leclercia adecarboxylata]
MRKLQASAPDTCLGPWRLRTCGEGSQTGDVLSPGKLQQVPAKRQNRGSRNSTGDVKTEKETNHAFTDN